MANNPAKIRPRLQVFREWLTRLQKTDMRGSGERRRREEEEEAVGVTAFQAMPRSVHKGGRQRTQKHLASHQQTKGWEQWKDT